ncbi:hypothetical protein [Massilia sp. TWR1-2-2]
MLLTKAIFRSAGCLLPIGGDASNSADSSARSIPSSEYDQRSALNP